MICHFLIGGTVGVVPSTWDISASRDEPLDDFVSCCCLWVVVSVIVASLVVSIDHEVLTVVSVLFDMVVFDDEFDPDCDATLVSSP